MKTSATIILITKEGNYKSIYLHYDGYPERAGRILKNYYQDYEKIEKLISLGDIASLGQEPDSTPALWDRLGDMFYPTEHPGFLDKHTFACKDRGDVRDESQEARISQELPYAADTCYTYLYQDGDWYMVNDNTELELL